MNAQANLNLCWANMSIGMFSHIAAHLRLSTVPDKSGNHIWLNFNDANIFGTMEICSRHGQFQSLRVNQSAI